ncbi:MAG TPA: CBS domain-containing protein [Planctomycetaceae bacterium]|nr:CBS domain-containing protein [Planctomycetaceae bacterium]
MRTSAMFAKEVVSVDPRTPLSKAAELMDQHGVGAVVVAEHSRPVGIVTDRDIAMAVCGHGVDRGENVQKIMTCPVTTIKQSDGVYRATQQLMEAGVRRVPVVDDCGRLVGIVTLDDLLLLLSRELKNMAEGIKAEMPVA